MYIDLLFFFVPCIVLSSLWYLSHGAYLLDYLWGVTSATIRASLPLTRAECFMWFSFLAFSPYYFVAAIMFLHDARRQRKMNKQPIMRIPPFLYAWIIPPLALFSVTKFSLPRFYIGIFPAAAIAMGIHIFNRYPERFTRKSIAFLTVPVILYIARFVLVYMPEFRTIKSIGRENMNFWTGWHFYFSMPFVQS